MDPEYVPPYYIVKAGPPVTKTVRTNRKTTLGEALQFAAKYGLPLTKRTSHRTGRPKWESGNADDPIHAVRVTCAKPLDGLALSAQKKRLKRPQFAALAKSYGVSEAEMREALTMDPFRRAVFLAARKAV